MGENGAASSAGLAAGRIVRHRLFLQAAMVRLVMDPQEITCRRNAFGRLGIVLIFQPGEHVTMADSFTVSVSVSGGGSGTTVKLGSQETIGTNVTFYGVPRGQQHLQVQFGNSKHDSYPDIQDNRTIYVQI
jgi:hypothetical protein